MSLSRLSEFEPLSVNSSGTGSGARDAAETAIPSNSLKTGAGFLSEWGIVRVAEGVDG